MVNQCRTCGDDIESFDFVDLFDEQSQNLLYQIELITGLSLRYNPDLPKYMCACCHRDLNFAIAFRDRCMNTQRQIKQEQINQLPYPEELDPLSNEPITSEDSDESSKSESPGESSNVDNEDYEDEDVDILIKNIDIFFESENYKEQPTDLINSDDKPVKQKRRKYMSWKHFTPEEIKILKREQRKRNCICEQCGRHFTDPSNLKLHLLRHTGIKNFQCELCFAKFYTSHLLRNHKVLHTANSPYTCKHCGRPFSNRTTQMNHERRHTNERPFACNLCDKRFICKSNLSAHMAVHSSDRNFRCEICDKRYKQQRGLDKHYETSFHKENELKMRKETEIYE